jgi:hypothetical protein
VFTDPGKFSKLHGIFAEGVVIFGENKDSPSYFSSFQRVPKGADNA